MKKIFSLLMVVTIVATALVFNTRSASAAPSYKTTPPTHQYGVPTLVVYSSEFAGLTPGDQVKAQMFVDSNFRNLYCVVKDTAGNIVCKFSKSDAGKSVNLHLTVGDQTLIFFVTVPQLPVINIPV